MIKEYKIDNKTKRKFLLKILLELFIYNSLFMLGVVYFKNIRDIELIMMLILTLTIIWTILTVIPLLLLYFNHMKHAKLVILKFDSSSNLFFFNDFYGSSVFKIEDIEKVILYLSPSSYEKWVDWLFFGKYHFSVINLKNGKSITISCLVCDEIEKLIPENLIERKKKVIPLIE